MLYTRCGIAIHFASYQVSERAYTGIQEVYFLFSLLRSSMYIKVTT
jgi:hypothetical protein